MLEIANNKTTPPKIFKAIMELYEKGNYNAILLRSSQLIEEYPFCINLHHILGVITFKSGNTKVAVEHFRKVIEIKPNHPKAYNDLGTALFELKKYGQSITAFKKAIQLNPKLFEAYNNLGKLYGELKEYDKAILNYKKSIEQKQNNFESYNSIAIIFISKGDLNGAIKILLKAVKLDPKNFVAYNNIGVLQKRIGNLEYSKKSYIKAININSDYFEAHQNLANLYREVGDYKNAISSYKKALKIKPYDTQVKHMLNAVCGNTTMRPPKEYVENLFDEYAENFEISLKNNLDYKIPQLIASYLKMNNFNSNNKILDLGCGTGLLGLELSEYFGYIEGIDLSSLMIEKAKSKNVYNKLSKTDIIEYLSKEKLDFDIFISADVFVYIGDLNNIFRLIKSRNKRKGKLIFSTEHSNKKDFFLEKTGRYSHSKKYITKLCKQFDYQISFFKKTKLRKQSNHFIIGGIYVLDF